MKLPDDVEYVEDACLFIWRPRGVLNEAVVNNKIVFVREQEDSFGGSFNRFTDLSAIERSISISITSFTSHPIDACRMLELR
jgi:hypothetical protein